MAHHLFSRAGFLVLCFAILAVGSAHTAGQPTAREAAPDVWVMPPPWPGDGQPLKDMVSRGGEWTRARGLVRGMGYWPWLLNVHFSDDEIRAFFACLDEWRLGLGFEVPVVKAANWGGAPPLDAETAFGQLRDQTDRFRPLGMPKIKWFAFDEPLYAARHVIPSTEDPAARLARGVRETAAFIALMREAHPDALLGDIEPYPALTEEEILGSVVAIQEDCAARGVKGLDFLRLDVDWDRMERTGEGSWEDVKRIEDQCRTLGIAFSLIYWAADEPRLANEGSADAATWRNGILKQRDAYEKAGGRPDQTVIESWLHVPVRSVPETDPDTFTGSILAFFGKD
jgi:hypothetical protein